MTTGRPDYTSSTVIRGQDPSGNLVPVAVDASGNLVALIYGSDGSVLRAVKVDTSGQLIMVPRGQSGNYMAVDASGNLSALLKGAEAGGTLHTLLVDANGQAVMVPRGQSGNYMAVDLAGNLASVMKGLDGVTLRTVAVDASGNIIGILKGDYAGALKTLAVDSQGRMLAVLTDPEDVFGNPHYIGAAELAARLGSIDRFERQGQVLMLDSFEDGFPRFTSITSGAGASVILSSDGARSGAYSVKVLSSATNNQESGIETSIPLLKNVRTGCEISAVVPPADCYWVSYFTVYTGTTVYTSRVRYLPVSQVLQIWNSAGAWVTVATGVTTNQGGINWTTIKLVVNPSTGFYSRVLFNGTLVDLSAYAMQSAASSTAPSIYISPRIATQESATVGTYFDDVILTQNEP